MEGKLILICGGQGIGRNFDPMVCVLLSDVSDGPGLLNVEPIASINECTQNKACF